MNVALRRQYCSSSHPFEGWLDPVLELRVGYMGSSSHPFEGWLDQVFDNSNASNNF